MKRMRVTFVATIVAVAALLGAGLGPVVGSAAAATPTPTATAPAAAPTDAPAPAAAPTDAPERAAPTDAPEQAATTDAPAPAPAAEARTAAPAPAGAPAPAPAAAPADTTSPAQPLVSNSPQQLAQALVAAHSAGTFLTNPDSIFQREIAPVATGQALNGCAVDVRILQVIVLTLNRFGSLTVSDIQRPCIGSNLNCGAPTYSVHCITPAEAVDIARVGGVNLNGSNTTNLQLLRLLDNAVPAKTNAGQAGCRAAAGVSLSLAHINQFDDSCNHQHIDFRSTNAPLNPAVLGAPLPTLNQAAALTNALYTDYLGRTPGTSEVTFWATKVANGAPRSSITDGFVNSDEYRLLRIDAAYSAILGRTADSNGRSDWLRAMQNGYITTDDIEKSFYESQEYYANNGATDTGFAAGLYSALLHRSGSADDYTFWAGLVRAHSRVWVVEQFWNSPETISTRVGGMYQLYLGRPADDAGLAYWVGLALQLGDSGLRSALTSSQEYFTRAQARFPQN